MQAQALALSELRKPAEQEPFLRLGGAWSQIKHYKNIDGTCMFLGCGFPLKKKKKKKKKKKPTKREFPKARHTQIDKTRPKELSNKTPTPAFQSSFQANVRQFLSETPCTAQVERRTWEPMKPAGADPLPNESLRISQTKKENKTICG